MKIVNAETLVCEFGPRTISFLKVTTSDGVEGWSEFSEGFGSPGLTGVVDAMLPSLTGLDPMQVEAISYDLNAKVRPARGGMTRQAIAAIENAVLDIKGKALGVPVAALFGGIVRDRIPVYWSHCGTYRALMPDVIGAAPFESYDDVVDYAKEVRKLGFQAMKTNVLGLTEAVGVRGHSSPFSRDIPNTTRHADTRFIAEAERGMAAFREGAGDDADIFFDANFVMDLDGYLRLEAALRPYRPAWLELDTVDADALAHLRQRSETQIGSCEAIYERVGYRPFFEKGAMDVAIIDVLWNGWLEAVKIAAMAEAYTIPVAPHNFYGHLATAISAHFSAAVPNLHIMEVDIEGVSWRDDLTTPPIIEDGTLTLPTAPGWGVEVNEEAIRAHAPAARRS